MEAATEQLPSTGFLGGMLCIHYQPSQPDVASSGKSALRVIKLFLAWIEEGSEEI